MRVASLLLLASCTLERTTMLATTAAVVPPVDPIMYTIATSYRYEFPDLEWQVVSRSNSWRYTWTWRVDLRVPDAQHPAQGPIDDVVRRSLWLSERHGFALSGQQWNPVAEERAIAEGPVWFQGRRALWFGGDRNLHDALTVLLATGPIRQVGFQQAPR